MRQVLQYGCGRAAILRLGNRATFAKLTYFQEGRPWWEWHQIALRRAIGPTITFAFVATYNHFVLDRSGKVFKLNLRWSSSCPLAAAKTSIWGCSGCSIRRWRVFG